MEASQIQKELKVELPKTVLLSEVWLPRSHSEFFPEATAT